MKMYNSVHTGQSPSHKVTIVVRIFIICIWPSKTNNEAEIVCRNVLILIQEGAFLFETRDFAYIPFNMLSIQNLKSWYG